MIDLNAETTEELMQGMTLVEHITMFGSITDQDPESSTFKQRIPFDLWPRQEEVCSSIELALRALLPKSRQKGYSEIAAERSLKTLFQHQNVKGAVISKSEDFAKEFLSSRVIPKYNYMREMFPDLEFPKIVRNTKEEIEWEGGRILKSISCSNTAAASLTLDFLVVDEAGGIDENKGATGEHSLFRSILDNSIPALDQNSSSWLMVIGTSVPGTYYNQLVREAYDKQNEGEFKYFFIGWHDQPGRDIKWYKRQHELLKENVFLQHPTDMDDFFFIKEGLVFQHFDAREDGKHIRTFKIGEEFYRKHNGKLQKLKASFNLRYITAYDHGTSHPAVNLYGLHDQYSDVLYIIGETFFRDGHGSDYKEIANAIIKKKKSYPRYPDREVADGSIFNEVGARSIGQLFGDVGLRFKKARKHDESASREVVACRFRDNTIIIHSDCVNLISQLNGYRWDPKSKGEKPIQKDDDAIDALRYLCAECKMAKHKRSEPFKDVYERNRERKAWNVEQLSPLNVSQAWQGY